MEFLMPIWWLIGDFQFYDLL